MFDLSTHPKKLVYSRSNVQVIDCMLLARPVIALHTAVAMMNDLKAASVVCLSPGSWA